MAAVPHREARNPLHGITLETILNELVERCGWEEMGRAVNIRCFQVDPSVGSSLHFLRRTPWARRKVEEFYLKTRPKAGAAPKDSTPASGPSPAVAEPRPLRAEPTYDRSALRAHTLNRSHAHHRSDNRSKV